MLAKKGLHRNRKAYIAVILILVSKLEDCLVSDMPFTRLLPAVVQHNDKPKGGKWR